MTNRLPDFIRHSLFPMPHHTGHAPVRRARTADFIERTMAGAVSFLRDAVSNEEIAGRDGLLQRRDPRAKAVGLILLLGAALASQKTIELAVLYGATLAVVMLSRISPGAFLKRTLPFIPLFSLFITLPAIFNVVTPGDAVISWRISGFTVSITHQGLSSAGLFLMRVTTSVSLAVLLVLTTRHHALLKALRTFRVPQIFVMTMGMTYRYIFLFLDIIQNTLTGIKSRVGFVTSVRAGQKVAGMNIANLWLRSYRLQSQVYDAMLSRGYDGEPRVMEEPRLRPGDYILVAVSAATLIGIICLNRFSH